MDMRFIDIDAQQPDSLTAYIVQYIVHTRCSNVHMSVCMCVCVSKYNYTKSLKQASILILTVNQNLFHGILQNSVIVMKIQLYCYSLSLFL